MGRSLAVLAVVAVLVVSVHGAGDVAVGHDCSTAEGTVTCQVTISGDLATLIPDSVLAKVTSGFSSLVDLLPSSLDRGILDLVGFPTQLCVDTGIPEIGRGCFDIPGRSLVNVNFLDLLNTIAGFLDEAVGLLLKQLFKFIDLIPSMTLETSFRACDLTFTVRALAGSTQLFSFSHAIDQLELGLVSYDSVQRKLAFDIPIPYSFGAVALQTQFTDLLFGPDGASFGLDINLLLASSLVVDVYTHPELITVGEVVDCARKTSCSACVAVTQCGWCSSTNMCVQAFSDGGEALNTCGGCPDRSGGCGLFQAQCPSSVEQCLVAPTETTELAVSTMGTQLSRVQVLSEPEISAITASMDSDSDGLISEAELNSYKADYVDDGSSGMPSGTKVAVVFCVVSICIFTVTLAVFCFRENCRGNPLHRKDVRFKPKPVVATNNPSFQNAMSTFSRPMSSPRGSITSSGRRGSRGRKNSTGGGGGGGGGGAAASSGRGNAGKSRGPPPPPPSRRPKNTGSSPAKTPSPQRLPQAQITTQFRPGSAEGRTRDRVPSWRGLHAPTNPSTNSTSRVNQLRAAFGN